MTTSKNSVVAFILLTVVGLVMLGCSSQPPIEPAPTPAPATSSEPENGARSGANDGSSDAGREIDDASSASETPSETSTEGAQSPAEPSLANDDVTSIQDVAAGEQIEDAQGNLLAVYGVREWPISFENLTDEAQDLFPFSSDVGAVAASSRRLIAIDIGMCSAGIDAAGSGTAEFSVHDDAETPLATDPVVDRGVLSDYPVLQPGFVFPAAAECTRGWLPVVRTETALPTTARYVLAIRESAAAPVERHVYQWSVDATPEPTDPAAATEASPELFAAGQTVTFNSGRLEGTTVKVDGWAELVGAATGIDGTRQVGVSLRYCPASSQLPQFGLAVDGWNVIAPVASDDLLGGAVVDDPTQQCFEGWLTFVVPYGGVPTGFSASDGRDALDGFAQWSLQDAALQAPQ